jgi:hypothetical protein
MSKYTYEVNKDKTVNILREGSLCVVQTDDPATPGYDTFASKARAEEWAKEAITQYEADEARESALGDALGKRAEEAATLAVALADLGYNDTIAKEVVVEEEKETKAKDKK